MKKLIAMMVLSIITSSGVNAQTNWSIDPAHTKVNFSVTHLVISEVTGGFKVFGGKVISANEDFSDAKIMFTVDVASINTENEMRDNHLKTDDFFNAEKFQKMTFNSTSFKKVTGNKYKLEGDLTIRDVTKKVFFDVVYNGSAKDPWGNTKAGFKLNGKINRMEYGLKWNTLTEMGGAVVGSEIDITCHVQLVKEK